MVDPVLLTAATLFVSKLADGLAGEAGKDAWNGMKRLFDLIRGKLSGDESAQKVISSVGSGADAREAAASLSAILDRHAESDPEFRRELAALVSTGMNDPVAGRMVTQIYGNAQVGKAVTIGNVTGDVSF
ncbi:hypothetical protein GCM10022226_06820 [Sphaerisporangium flaviroseum]|uniref:Uncharacterized protein n=1 Tax=Sphaerisporangium flaviroseum TaxID=509199 RepID=A0ABP7HBP6_9ACTN